MPMIPAPFSPVPRGSMRSPALPGPRLDQLMSEELVCKIGLPHFAREAFGFAGNATAVTLTCRHTFEPHAQAPLADADPSKDARRRG